MNKSADNQQVVLLAEDSRELRDLIGIGLRLSGYEVAEAANGTEALTVFSQHETVSLLITDIVMPKMDGFELAGKLRQKQPDLPLLFISGYWSDVNMSELKKFKEPVGALQKPFTVRSLQEKAEELLNV